jgi:hypothetical protein
MSGELAQRYLRFAEQEARGRSPLYDAFACAVAGSPQALGFLLTLPPAKRQPNLLLAAVRRCRGVAADGPAFLRSLLADPEPVRAVMLTHATQTNEPGRCATLLPVLARLKQPLALIEVGASAGLCLLPDRYGYDYGRRALHPESAGHPVFPCDASATTPLPDALPRIAWRAGLDLNPLDPADPDAAAWLETLVWPEQTGRLDRLRAALRIAAEVRPRVDKGDLLGDDLARLCRAAPPAATLVIFHTAVLSYVPDPAKRAEFAARALSLGDCWISNEGPDVFPDTARQGVPGRFLLCVNGVPTARTDPHGAALEWLDPPDVASG